MQREEWHSAAWCKIMELGLLRGDTSSSVNVSCLPTRSEHASSSCFHGAQGFCSITFNFLEVFVWAVLTWNEYFSTRAGRGFSPEHGRDGAARSNCSALSSLPDSQWPSWVSSSQQLSLSHEHAACGFHFASLFCRQPPYGWWPSLQAL